MTCPACCVRHCAVGLLGVLLEEGLRVGEGEVPVPDLGAPDKGDEHSSGEEGTEGDGSFAAFSCFDHGDESNNHASDGSNKKREDDAFEAEEGAAHGEKFYVATTNALCFFHLLVDHAND